jgi:hypothetical protein
MEANNLSMPGAVISTINTTKKFAYNKGNMTFSVDVNIDSREQVTDMLDIMRICKSDLEAELAKFPKEDTYETRSEGTDSVQPVPQGEEA